MNKNKNNKANYEVYELETIGNAFDMDMIPFLGTTT